MQSDPVAHITSPAGEARSRLSPSSLSKLLFFGAAGLSFVASVLLFFSGDRERGIYVGLWVPSILSAGALLHGGSRHD